MNGANTLTHCFQSRIYSVPKKWMSGYMYWKETHVKHLVQQMVTSTSATHPIIISSNLPQESGCHLILTQLLYSFPCNEIVATLRAKPIQWHVPSAGTVSAVSCRLPHVQRLTRSGHLRLRWRARDAIWNKCQVWKCGLSVCTLNKHILQIKH